MKKIIKEQSIHMFIGVGGSCIGGQSTSGSIGNIG